MDSTIELLNLILLILNEIEFHDGLSHLKKEEESWFMPKDNWKNLTAGLKREYPKLFYSNPKPIQKQIKQIIKFLNEDNYFTRKR